MIKIVEVTSNKHSAGNRIRSKNRRENHKINFSRKLNIHFTIEALKIIGFNPIVFSKKDMSIRRPSIDSKKTNKIGIKKQASIGYDEGIIGEYELEKENEDLFYLIKK